MTEMVILPSMHIVSAKFTFVKIENAAGRIEGNNSELWVEGYWGSQTPANFTASVIFGLWSASLMLNLCSKVKWRNDIDRAVIQRMRGYILSLPFNNMIIGMNEMTLNTINIRMLFSATLPHKVKIGRRKIKAYNGEFGK